MKIKQNGEWHWFFGGLVVSLLAMATYVVYQALSYKSYPFGVTASFGQLAALFQYPFSSLSSNPVLQKYATSPSLAIDLTMLAGLVAGGYTAARVGKNYAPEMMPAVWKKYHGDSIIKRYLTVLIGGFLLGWGSVLAAGCTTGNILQGWAHLSLGSMVAGASFFIAGIVTAKLLYPKLRRN